MVQYEKRMNAGEFVAYKHHLIHYLEGYIQDLQHSAAQIGAQLDAYSTEQIAQMLDLVTRSELEVVPHPKSAQPSGGGALAVRGRLAVADLLVYRSAPTSDRYWM